MLTLLSNFANLYDKIKLTKNNRQLINPETPCAKPGNNTKIDPRVKPIMHKDVV